MLIRLLVNVIRLRSFGRAWWVYEYELAEFHAARVAPEKHTHPCLPSVNFWMIERLGKLLRM